MAEFDYICLRGADAEPYLDDLSRLRIEVFREFPYLYEGDLTYEKKYLETYFSCPESFVAVCKDRSGIIGATTAIPLKYETEEVKQPFFDLGLDPNQFMYFGESVLKKAYRGRGIGRTFFELRKAAAAEGSYPFTCFCAVIRPDDHPARPPHYQNLEPMWEKMGYKKYPELKAYFSWREVGEARESRKPMQFWMSQS